jgi:hypothetical protein
MINTETQRLRSYHSAAEEASNCRIWEAARATSAAPTFFDPITFENGFTFRDGALRDNNPVFELIDEVRKEFPNRNVSCIMSVGTGVPASIVVRNGLTSVAKACARITTDTQNVARRFEEVYCSRGAPYWQKYFRYNVSRGVQDVRLDEWEKGDIMMSSTNSYLRQEAQALAEGARRLGEGFFEPGGAPVAIERQERSEVMKSSGASSRLLATASESHIGHRRTHTQPIHLPEFKTHGPPSVASCSDISSSGAKHGEADTDEEHVISVTNLSLAKYPTRRQQAFDHFYQLDRIGRQPVHHFATRPELDRIKSLLSRQSQNAAVQVICLIGLGGAGKTQLMLQYASSERNQYGVVLWIDATSKETMASSYTLAASQLGLILPPFERAEFTSSSLIRYRPEFEMNIAAVNRELQRRGQPWLILFDGADDVGTIGRIRKYMPTAHNGHVLVSSRRKEAHLIGNYFIKVTGLPIGSARDLLIHHAFIQDPSDSDLDCAERIVRMLDCIALAVELAGRYISSSLFVLRIALMSPPTVH